MHKTNPDPYYLMLIIRIIKISKYDKRSIILLVFKKNTQFSIAQKKENYSKPTNLTESF